MRDEIIAVFDWTEDEYITACRASRRACDASCYKPVMRARFWFIGHLLLILPILIVGLAISGAKGENGPIPRVAIGMTCWMGLIAAYVVFTRWYGFPWLARRGLRSSPLAWATVRFDPRREARRSRASLQSTIDWRMFDRALELRDGFLLGRGATLDWILGTAFAEPFDELELAGILRS